MTVVVSDPRRELVALLQLAYSGEQAAALAYRGHWRSVRGEERERIRVIEEEEWHHRRQVGVMLHELGERADRGRERRTRWIGTVLGALCHVSGWLAPMYGAGQLESENIREYETAARLAHACGRHEWIDCLLTMAEIEHDHETYFREQVRTHALGRSLPLWKTPPPREAIRASFSEETGWRPASEEDSPDAG
ncbi:MAG: hypothetical protein AAF533_13490 [Acidobacteriota bacterium]